MEQIRMEPTLRDEGHCLPWVGPDGVTQGGGIFTATLERGIDICVSSGSHPGVFGVAWG